MATNSIDSGSVEKASRTSAYVRALKMPVVFLLAGLGLIAAYYSLYVRDSLEYLNGRNLRLLSALGSQIQASLDDHEKVLSSFSNYYRGRRFAEQFPCIAKATARQPIAIFDYVAPDLPADTSQSNPDCREPVVPDTDAKNTPPVVL